MNIYVASKFKREFRKLPISIQKFILERRKIFQKNPFDPSLKTHKLEGKFANYWSFSVNYSYRVIFEFIDDNALFHSIGNHDIYRWFCYLNFLTIR